MRNPLACITLCLAAWAWFPLGSAMAGFTVLANRTDHEMQFTLTAPPAKARVYTVKAGDITAIPLGAAANISFSVGKTTRRYPLKMNAVYYFADFPTGLNLEEIQFSTKAQPPESVGKTLPEAPVAPAARASVAGPLKITVKILVDEEEPGVRKVWEDRLRKRIEIASALLEEQCRVKLEVVAVGEWESDNKITEFTELLRDFERKVKPAPARLAIGFSSQRLPVTGRHYQGGTRQPLSTHILIREWMSNNERDRVEVLLHEIGHFLGAAHSPEPESVMRPVLGEKQPTVRRTRLGFDPINMLVVNLVAEEVRERGIKNLHEVSPAVRKRLTEVYDDLAQAMPDDANAAKYSRLLARASAALEATTEATATSARGQAESARVVVDAIVRAAERNHWRPARTDGAAGTVYRLTGDELTTYYVREAAAAARQLPAERAAGAYLLGLGIALDTSDLLRKNPATRGVWEEVEVEAERKQRLEWLGLPTARGRHDLAQHFFVSAALTALAGAKPAEAAGAVKELLDAQGESGFSFADLSADLAGIAFAEQVMEKPKLLEGLAASFALRDYVLDPAGLEDGLTRKEFAERYGSLSDERFREKLEGLRKRIRELPAHR